MVTVWEVATRGVKSQARGSIYDIKTIDFSPDGSLFVTAGRNEVRIWDAATGVCLLIIPSGNSVGAVAFSPDGRRLAVGSSPLFGSPGVVDVLDLEEGRGLRAVRPPAEDRQGRDLGGRPPGRGAEQRLGGSASSAPPHAGETARERSPGACSALPPPPKRTSPTTPHSP